MAGEKNFNIKNGLSIGGTEVIQTDGTFVGSISGTSLNEGVDDRVANLLTAGTGITLTYDDSANTLTIDGQTGDVTGVTAGDGLSGGGTSGDVSLAVNVDDSSIEIDSDSLRVKALGITDAMLAGSISNAKLTNSAVTVNSNSVSLGAAVVLDTDDIGEGSTNQYFTNERVDDRVNALITAGTNISTSYDDANGTLTISSSGKTEEEIEDIVNGLVVGGTNITSTYDDAAGTLTLAGLSDSDIRGLFSAGGDLSYNSGTGAFSVTTYTDSDARGAISVTDSAGDGTLSYNSTTGVITYSGITDAQVRGKVSVTDAGGDGSLAYDSSTGVITYTGPSASEVQAHITAGTGVSISSGAVSIGQSVGTSDNVSFADLKQTLLYFTKSLFGKSKIRLRPSYFPFTEPSAEVDIYWGLETESDYRITKGTGWLEIMGCGMVDPNVLKNCNIDPDVYSGFAFGMGLERMAMLLYQVEDIRMFYENDLRFLSQFKAAH